MRYSRILNICPTMVIVIAIALALLACGQPEEKNSGA